MNDNRILKKWAELSIFGKTYRYFGFLLPTLFSFAILIIGYVVFQYVSLSSQHSKIKEANASQLAMIKENQWTVTLISNYSKVVEKYDEYTNSLINYPVLFDTIEKYIPKNMERSSLKVERTKWWDINVNINGTVMWYDSYISLMNLVDKCNFMDPKLKKDFISMNKATLSSDGTKLAEAKSLSLTFNFNTQKNKLLWLDFYNKSVKKFSQYGNYLYLFDIVAWKRPDVWSENGIDYREPLNSIVADKEKFTTELSALAKIDSNGYYVPWTYGNFTTEYGDQNKVFAYLIDNLKKRKEKLLEFESEIYDTWVITYQWKKEKTERKVLELKEPIKKRISELDQEISYLTVLVRYNEYLSKENENNQLRTFENLKKNDKNAEKTIATTIKDYGILSDEDPVLEPFIGETQTTKERSEKSKQAYVKMFNFAKDADKKKKEYLDVKKKYIDAFYAEFYEDMSIRFTHQALKFFIDNGYDESILSKIAYKTFNMNSDGLNANFSYKKRFYLTLKNDANTRASISFLSDGSYFSKALTEYEDFSKQSKDLITYNNSKINCLEKDIKSEIRNIYSDILSEQTQKTETEKKKKELNIIIGTLQ